MIALVPTTSWTDPLYRPLAPGVTVGWTVSDTDPETLPAMWSPDRAVTLTVPEAMPPSELAGVLPEFLRRARDLADRPTTATLTLPSRDVDRALVARRAGLAPRSVLAVADLRAPVSSASAAASVRVRDAEPADADAIVGLWWEQTCFEARLGSLRATSAIRRAVEDAVPARIAGPAHTLVATAADDDVPVSVVIALRPEQARWAGARCSLAEVSYLALGATAEVWRGRGAAGALVAELHARHRAAGTPGSVLTYSPDNPLSVPFWSRQGYRPLLTTFGLDIG